MRNKKGIIGTEIGSAKAKSEKTAMAALEVDTGIPTICRPVDAHEHTRLQNGMRPQRKKGMRHRGTTYLIVDEVGDMGSEPKICMDGAWRPSKTFGFGVFVTKHRGLLDIVMRRYREKKGLEEVKGANVPSGSRARLGFWMKLLGKTYGYYVDKTKDRPDGWDEQRGPWRHTGTLETILDRTITLCEDEKIHVIIDDNTAFHGGHEGVLENITERLRQKHGKDISISYSDSKDEKDRDSLQAAELAARSLYEKMEDENGSFAKNLGMSIERLGEGDSVRIAQGRRKR